MAVVSTRRVPCVKSATTGAKITLKWNESPGLIVIGKGGCPERENGLFASPMLRLDTVAGDVPVLFTANVSCSDWVTCNGVKTTDGLVVASVIVPADER